MPSTQATTCTVPGLLGELPADHLRACQFALPWLDDAGLHYYLPAMMTLYIRTEGTGDVGGLADSLKLMLTRFTGKCCARLKRFSHAQLDAVAEFAQYVSDTDYEATRSTATAASWPRQCPDKTDADA